MRADESPYTSSRNIGYGPRRGFLKHGAADGRSSRSWGHRAFPVHQGPTRWKDEQHYFPERPFDGKMNSFAPQTPTRWKSERLFRAQNMTEWDDVGIAAGSRVARHPLQVVFPRTF